MDPQNANGSQPGGTGGIVSIIIILIILIIGGIYFWNMKVATPSPVESDIDPSALSEELDATTDVNIDDELQEIDSQFE